ncbi:MAG: sensor histidine kinase [Oliverpabstia sp.]
MEYLLLSAIGILLLIIFTLSAKIYFLRRSTQEIIDAFQDKLAADTNTLIDISSRDPYMRKLASEINIQLRLLRKERHRYQQGDQELKESITNISHDLRTPLTAICGYLDLLEREEKNESVRRYLSQIENRTGALKNLTEELLRYSVITSSPKLNPQRMDLVRALEESLLSFYGVMQEKEIQPQIVLPEEPVWCTLDTEAVNRIFSNIICNALKYSDGDFYVSMKKDGSITFSNTAQNLDAVTTGRLFDRFYTVETSHNSTGLGLSIAKLLTERMGGTITADYSHGRLHIRTRFMTCTVPVIDSCS